MADDEPVFHIGDGRFRPSHEFGFVALEPGAKDAAQNHLVAAGLDRDAIGIDLSLVPERLLYSIKISVGSARGSIATMSDTPFTPLIRRTVSSAPS